MAHTDYPTNLQKNFLSECIDVYSEEHTFSKLILSILGSCTMSTNPGLWYCSTTEFKIKDVKIFEYLNANKYLYVVCNYKYIETHALMSIIEFDKEDIVKRIFKEHLDLEVSFVYSDRYYPQTAKNEDPEKSQRKLGIFEL